MTTSICAIYPAIGVARVGNAPTEFYIGPESCGGLPILPGSDRPFGPADFRDAQGRLRRQAARFRVFREGPDGPEEVTLDTPGVKEIRWTVHLANKKASWYRFLTSRGEQGYAPNHPLRNADKVTPQDRRRLIIDPGKRQISGRQAGGPSGPVEFSRGTIPPEYKGGSFPPTTLNPYTIDTLGALETDEQGRLLLLGGFGHSGSTSTQPELTTYANNDGWWDDTSDGPVQATVVLASGESIDAEPAWALVAPPGYAPQLPNLVTLYDTIFDTSVRLMGCRPDIFANGFWKAGPDGYQPFFDSDIRPIFDRAAGYVWVTAIPPKPHTFDYARLGDPSEALNQFRQFYLDVIRAPGSENVIIKSTSGATMMPYLAGDDALGASDLAGAAQATSKFLRLTDTQYFFLQQWARGHFRTGAEPEPHAGRRLTRAVLENCVGGGFSPGIEMTWISRNPAIYRAPFRIKVRTDIPDPLSLGFDPAGGLEPGDVCRYMALPWQADFNECSSQPIEGRVMWWWPAQRPEFIYLSDRDEPTSTVKAGETRLGVQAPWVGTDYDQNAPDYISFSDNVEMVVNWDKLGFVYNVGTAGKPRFVEVSRVLRRSKASTEPP